MAAIIRKLKEEDFEDVISFLRDHFLPDEPLWQPYPAEQYETIEHPKRREYRLALIRQGTSLVALDPQNGRFLGMALAGTLHPNDLVHHTDIPTDTRLGKILQFLDDIKVRAKIFEVNGVSKALYLHILSVDSSCRRQGVAKRLITQLIELGRSKGFPLVVATCTSRYSWNLLRSFGMECILSQNYADYKDEDGNVVFQPQAPHEKVYVVTMKL